MLHDILDLRLVRCGLECRSKKRVLEDIAHIVHDSLPHIPPNTLFKKLHEREQISSTALGQGVAIPHCRSADITSITACFISLSKGIDFEAPDDEPVDILCALLVPEEEAEAHLEVLAILASLFSQPHILKSLRHCNSDAELLTNLLAHADTDKQ